MLGYLLIWGSVGIVSAVTGTSENFNTTVKIGRCRAQCLETFASPDPAHDPECRSTPDCNMCWGVCSSLFTSYNLYGAVCEEKKICTRGCVTACKFRHQPPPATKKQNWIFPGKVISYLDSVKTEISWQAPEPPNLAQSGQLLVYILLVRGKQQKDSAWKELEQTASTEIRFKTETLPNLPEFQLFAVTNKGVVAKTTFAPDSIIVETNLPRTGVLEKSPVATYIADAGPLNISLDMDMKGKQLHVTLIWNHPSREVLECAKTSAKTRDVCFYNIDWFMNNCAAYPDAPPCESLPYHEAQTIHFLYNETPKFSLPGIEFNSEYSVKISIRDTHDDIIGGDSMFKTPLCIEPGIDNTYCEDDTTTFTKNNPVKESSTQPISQGQNKTVKSEHYAIANFTEVTTDSTSKANELVEFRVNEKPRMTYDPATDMMDVNVTWTTDLNQSVFERYVIIWQEGDLYPSQNETKKSYVLLKLDIDKEYNIEVIAIYKDDNNKQVEISDSINIITQRNLSSSSVLAQPITQPHKHDLSTLSGVIVAVVVATILIIVGFVVLFYKKRKSFKDIIITKTFVTKSNSYKSNVGAGKSNYSNQLMVISDEWELDPKLLKFSTPLGQGAFGKVVTGYCSDRKVAIKLVKEGAPLSYKEDLVAEINLMKRIGSNPNIVAMIGACTLNEPIALVMEFVPHGNLQNFLKKCRMEGDLRKRSDGASEIAYSMVHDSGGIEDYLITPADMLSFARQVAMAMEYLTDRRYVHRDLAARNVLLGHNKVVKLCDFGLSRDIYNDNQYKKLTNGKLPLKWMAIESLRDRVFTTQSDVWSFGVLLWEIVTMGASPYPHIALSDLYYVLVNGYRMEKTSNCSDELYAIMLHCWAALPNDRPCFTQLRMMLEELLEQDRDYLVLENINVPLNTSENSSSPSSLDDMSTQPSGTSSGILVTPLTKDELRVNVCIHEKSTDRLLRKSESDSSP